MWSVLDLYVVDLHRGCNECIWFKYFLDMDITFNKTHFPSMMCLFPRKRVDWIRVVYVDLLKINILL